MKSRDLYLENLLEFRTNSVKDYHLKSRGKTRHPISSGDGKTVKTEVGQVVLGN